MVPPSEYPSDTEGIITDETRAVLTTRITRQKFLDDTMTQAFIRKLWLTKFLILYLWY